MPQSARRVVLGIGNTLNHDEGVGVEAVGRLKALLGARAGVEFVDGGVMGMNLLILVEECSHLLVLDAADARRPPGALIELTREQIPLYAGIRLSQHQITFQEVLGLANMRGKLPGHLDLIGAQPADLTLGIGLSPVVEAAMPGLIEKARAVIETWGSPAPSVSA